MLVLFPGGKCHCVYGGDLQVTCAPCPPSPPEKEQWEQLRYVVWTVPFTNQASTCTQKNWIAYPSAGVQVLKQLIH
jgi:hypothetical protein